MDYFICYELPPALLERDADQLVSDAYKEHFHFRQNTWVIRTDESPEQVFRYFSNMVQPYGRLLFAALTNGTWGSTDDAAPQWLGKLERTADQNGASIQ